MAIVFEMEMKEWWIKWSKWKCEVDVREERVVMWGTRQRCQIS